MKTPFKQVATRKLQNIESELLVLTPDQYSEVIVLSTKALEIAFEAYEDLLKSRKEPKEFIEVLRINVQAFNLTIDKIKAMPDAKIDGFKIICCSFIQIFKTVIRDYETELGNGERA